MRIDNIDVKILTACRVRVFQTLHGERIVSRKTGYFFTMIMMPFFNQF